MTSALYVRALVLIFTVHSAGLAQKRIEPDISRPAQEHFLSTARIVSIKPIGQGITHTRRLTLSDGKRTHDAHFQNVDIYKEEYKTPEFTEKNFRDSYKYNIAAYRIDKMIGLGMVPACVYREVEGKGGALSWWVDDVQFDELTRRQKKAEPTDYNSWVAQLNLVRDFDALIDNTDRNQGNLLIDRQWQVWMIDHSRAFRLTTELRNPQALKRVTQRFLEGIRGLNLETCMRELQPFLTEDEIRTMLVRRDRLLKFFADKIAEDGAAAVYTDMPVSTPHVTIP